MLRFSADCIASVLVRQRLKIHVVSTSQCGSFNCLCCANSEYFVSSVCFALGLSNFILGMGELGKPRKPCQCAEPERSKKQNLNETRHLKALRILGGKAHRKQLLLTLPHAFKIKLLVIIEP